MTSLLHTVTACLLAAGFAAPLNAGLVTSIRGDVNPGFNNGDFPGIFDLFDLTNDGPFGNGYNGKGNEVSGPNFSASWTHSFAPITAPIVSALLTIGIHDAEGGSVGNAGGQSVTLFDEQLDFFRLGSTNTSLRSALIAAGFESPGQGLNNQYNEYTVALPGSLFGELATGSIDVALGLKGPVFSPGLVGPGQIHDFNSATLVHSTLTIETGSTAVPEPSSLVILSVGGLGVLWVRRRQLPRIGSFEYECKA